MGILSKLAGKAIKEGIEGGLKGRKTKALLTRPELPPEAPAAPVARETPAIQPTPTPAEIPPLTTDMAPITPAPPVAADKQARMIMLQGAKEQEIIKSQIDQPVYHTSREIEEIETFDPQKLKQKAIKGNIASGEGLYTTPSLEASRSKYYMRAIPEDIQKKYIQKGEANTLIDAEKLYRQGKLSPEEIEDLIYDAKTYEIKLKEDFNPIVITNKKGKKHKIKELTPEERTDFLQRNPNYKFGPIIKHEGIWKSQQELEEIGFEGVIDASEKFKWKDIKGVSKHEIAVWPSGLSKIDHKLVRGIGAREDPIKEEMDKLVPSAGGSGGGKNIDVPITGGRGGGKGGGGGDGIGITEEDMINNPLKIEEWRKITPLKNDPATVKRRQTRKFEEEANKLDREEITLEEFKTEAFSGKEPVRKFTKDMLSDLIQPYVNMLGALGKGKVFDKAGNLNIINYKNKGKNIASGERVTGRLDIPAYQQFNVWVNQVAHEKKALYSRTTHLKDVTFVTDPEKAFEVAKNVKKKSPFATMDGLWQNTSDDDVLEMAQKYIDNPDWKQLGFDPDRASYYYDKTPDSSGNFLPVEYVEEIIQIGPFVLGKGVKYNKELLKSFNKGGVVDMRNGGGIGAVGEAAALMASGGQASNPWERGGWKSKEQYMSTAKKDYGDFKNWSVFAKKMGIVPPTAYVPPFEEARAFSPVLMSGKRIYKGAIVQQDNPLKGGSSRMTKAELSEFQNKGTYKLWQKRLAKQAKSSFKMTKDLVHGTPSKKGDFGYVGTQEKFSGISGDTPTDQRTIIGFKGEGSDPSIPTFGKEARSKIMSGPEYMNRRGITGEYINLNKALQEKPDPFAGELSRVGQESWRTKQERQDFIKQMEAQDLSTPSETVEYAGKRGGIIDMRNGGRVGAAVVAASLMANGGQAMAMEEGGWLEKIGRGFSVGNVNVGLDLYNKEEVMDAINKVSDALPSKNKEDTRNLLIETGQVESRLGKTYKDINRANIVGPMQISRIAHQDIMQRMKNKSSMKRNVEKFKQTEWGKDIDWKNVSYNDLKNPLLNVAFSRLFYSKFLEDIPSTREGRSVYWKKYYNTYKDKAGTPKGYMAAQK